MNHCQTDLAMVHSPLTALLWATLVLSLLPGGGAKDDGGLRGSYSTDSSEISFQEEMVNMIASMNEAKTQVNEEKALPHLSVEEIEERIKQAPRDQSVERIVGGTEAETDQFPYFSKYASCLLRCRMLSEQTAHHRLLFPSGLLSCHWQYFDASSHMKHQHLFFSVRDVQLLILAYPVIVF